MIETFREFSFEAALSLPPHETLQRHAFRVCLHMRGDPDPVYGWPIHTNELERHVRPVLQALQQRHLNEVEGLALPSTENIARWIWDRLIDRLPVLSRVSVSRGRDGAREGCTYSVR
jgi:6-pyruvoyltetrahydropterin/6-carboxytetrahydropterin synthase